MKASKLKKRFNCLKPHELAYLLLASSVVTGCTQSVEKLPDYNQALEYCKSNPAYCQEKEKMDQLAGNNNGATGSYGPMVQTHSSGNSFLNYYLMYHLFFSRSSNVNPSSYQSRFSNLDSSKIDEKRNQYRGYGVYTPGYVSRMQNSIATGQTSYESSSGKVYKSSQFSGEARSSLTGKSISRGGFGSSGRSFGVSS